MLHEDDDLLVVNKPAGWNTHAPSPYAGEGIYDWLRHREPRWSELAIVHRLDKETSGVLVFTKCKRANRSLTEQFTARGVSKTYLLLTDRKPPRQKLKAVSNLTRAGERYISKPARGSSERAETEFVLLKETGGRWLVEAHPLTGRTHQIRVHAADNGFPILGDTLYGGTPWQRVCLHAERICFRHPATNEEVEFHASASFDADPREALRVSCLQREETNAFRLCHGAADGQPGLYVDRLGDCLLAQSEQSLNESQRRAIEYWMKSSSAKGVYHKVLTRYVRQKNVTETSPQPIMGEPAPRTFVVTENGVSFEMSFEEGYSVGLFLDQRDNRRRFLTNHVAAGFPLFDGGAVGKSVLNTFAYTCGFSVCAAKAGATAVSLDLSKKYLEWGKRNFALNGLDAANHDFIFGDVFDWLRRLRKKGRLFDAIVLDPPTFSHSKEHGIFRAETDFPALMKLALALLKPAGVVLASTNAAILKPERFIAQLHEAAKADGRKVVQEHYVPQPPDFPVTRDEPAYLKTVWMRVD
ncbi:MAG: pseudouridine synthase [Verrucomicrobiota bacterium]